MAGARRRCSGSSPATTRAPERTRPSPRRPRPTAPRPDLVAAAASILAAFAFPPLASANPPPAPEGSAPDASHAKPGAAPAAPPAAAPAAPPAPPRPIEVRFALSPAAAEAVSEARLRRLLYIELPEGAVLAQGSVGPLEDHVANVWIDRPTPARLEIQVRLGGRPVTRRAIAISGLTSDVAARLVAIATAETVHAEIRRARAPRRPPPPRRPSPEEIELAARDKDAFSLGAGAYAAIATAEPDVLAGPGLAVSIRRFRVTQSLFARWLGGPLDEGAVRWLEVGVAADYRIWASRSWRFWLGASAAAASLRLSGVGAVDGLPGEQDAWTVRAGGLLGVEARLAGPLWMGLTLEPGAILRPVPYEDARGASRAVEGAWLGAGLTLTLEPPPAPPAR